MPLTAIPAATFPAYVQCATCIYWVPDTELVDGQCVDCFTLTEWEEVS